MGACEQFGQLVSIGAGRGPTACSGRIPLNGLGLPNHSYRSVGHVGPLMRLPTDL